MAWTRPSFAFASVVATIALPLASCRAPATPPPASARSTASTTATTSTAHAAPFGPQEIDAALRAEWKRASVTPAPRADDATFVRRAWIDIVGTIPPVDVTTKFLADGSPDKRAKLVDTLIASPEYGEHWMNYWDDVLMGRDAKGNVVDRVAFRSWLEGRFAAHAPWSAIVTDLVSATGRNGGGKRPKRGPALALGSSLDDDEDDDLVDDSVPINGAVNWTLRFEQNPQDFGGSASRTFLGVQIQCAQCHDHKTESWKQDDFRRFSSAFFRSRIAPIDRGKMKQNIKRVDLLDAPAPAPRFSKKAELVPLLIAKPTALDGTDLDKGGGTRKALAAWMTSKDNKWFAKAFVNRMWGHFLGRGFYDPVDDIRPSNPASAPELLDEIAADFAAHDFDIAYLIRTICATEAYNLSAQRSGSTADPENKLWAHFHLVPLGPEELLNAVFRATDVTQAALKAGFKDIESLRTNVIRQYAFVFDTDEEADAPDYSGTITQALTLLNGGLVKQGSRAIPGGAIAELLATPGSDADKIDALVVKVLSRHATSEERERWVAYVGSADLAPAARAGVAPANAKGGKRSPLDRLSNKHVGLLPKSAAYEDILWALLNSSEFTFNH